MTDLELLKEFTKDVNNQQMSIHAYTLYVMGLVGSLTSSISKLTEVKTCHGCVHLKKNWAGRLCCYHESENQCARLKHPVRPDFYQKDK